MSFARLLYPLGLAVALGSCGGDDSASLQTRPIGYVGISIPGSAPLPTVFGVGRVTGYSVSIGDADSVIIMGVHPRWSSSDTNIATIELTRDSVSSDFTPFPSIIVHGIAPGYATIKVTAGGISAEGPLYVSPVSFVGVSNESLQMHLGDEVNLTATPYDIHNVVMPGLVPLWHSRDDNVVTVDQQGHVHATGVGDTYIEVSIEKLPRYIYVVVQ